MSAMSPESGYGEFKEDPVEHCHACGQELPEHQEVGQMPAKVRRLVGYAAYSAAMFRVGEARLRQAAEKKAQWEKPDVTLEVGRGDAPHGVPLELEPDSAGL